LRNLSVLYLLLSLSLVFFVTPGCNKKPGVQIQHSSGNNGPVWKEELSTGDLPDFPVKGELNGKNVNFEYIVFEKWRGSNDNDIIFSLVKPAQQCGYIENYEGFQLLNKGNQIEHDEWVKRKFTDDPKTYQCSYVYKTPDGSSVKSSVNWNCVINIESISNKTVSGKIAICFDDSAKSWIAGKFEASVCSN
jgi:hypothetical protein